MSDVMSDRRPSLWAPIRIEAQASDHSPKLVERRGFALAPEGVCRAPLLPTGEARSRSICSGIGDGDLALLFTFHLVDAKRLYGVSMVSVALSLGLRETFGTCPFVFRYIPAAVSRLRFHSALRRGSVLGLSSPWTRSVFTGRPSVHPSGLRIAKNSLSVKT